MTIAAKNGRRPLGSKQMEESTMRAFVQGRYGSIRTTPGSTSPGRRMSMEENSDGVAGPPPPSTLQRLFAGGRAPLIWGVGWGIIQAAAPLGFWWLDAATVYGMSIALIATVYIGFAVADGRCVEPPE